jgi:Transposase DDE domain
VGHPPAPLDGKARYAKRRETVEPVFGQLKEQQGARRFLRRGLVACEAEWKLLCGAHNLLKLYRHATPRHRRSPAERRRGAARLPLRPTSHGRPRSVSRPRHGTSQRSGRPAAASRPFSNTLLRIN